MNFGGLTNDYLLKAYAANKNGSSGGKEGISSQDFLAVMQSKKAESLAGTNKTDNESVSVSELYAKIYTKIELQANEQIKTEDVSETAAVSLETMLKEKYPNLVYHVFDASSSYWRTRNDYPHYMLYQQNADVQALENWKPNGPNPEYGASKEIRALGSVPPGSKAVVIHPKVQERMEQDPEYAKEIMERIETWFTFDLLRNEAIMPGHSMELSQCVAIGEDGSIVNAVTSSQGRITYSKSGKDDEPDFWEVRANRHAYFMKLWMEKQIEHSMDISRQFAAMSSAEMAKTQLAEMMQGDTLKNIFGDMMAGVSTDYVLEHTKSLIWG